jgi:hypothetical protein
MLHVSYVRILTEDLRIKPYDGTTGQHILRRRRFILQPVLLSFAFALLAPTAVLCNHPLTSSHMDFRVFFEECTLSKQFTISHRALSFQSLFPRMNRPLNNDRSPLLFFHGCMDPPKDLGARKSFTRLPFRPLKLFRFVTTNSKILFIQQIDGQLLSNLCAIFF